MASPLVRNRLLTVLVMTAALTGCANRNGPPVRTSEPAQTQGPIEPSNLLPTVAIVTTGGTIAMSPDARAGGAVPTVSGADLVNAVPELKQHAHLRVIPLVNIDSRDMTPELWLKLARLVQNTLADARIAGVVITHGTDTMEDSAFLLDSTLAGDKPVVLTGAQRDATARDADGPRNLLNAVRQVVAPGSRGRGVTVTLNGKIIAARAVSKSHTGNVEAFAGGYHGQLGEIDDEQVTWFSRPERHSAFPIPDQLPKVDLVCCYPGADGGLIDSAIAGGARGVVVCGYGIGNVNLPVFQAIERARKKSIHVVLTTRVTEGRVCPVYGGAGGGTSMKQLGVVFGGDLLPWKARILLMLGLTLSDDPAELQSYFDR